MAQLIFIDSGMLVDVGEEFPEFDPKFHQIVDTGQVFHEFRVPKKQVWFYCPATEQFYLSNRKKHGLINALQSKFEDQERWDEILDVLEDLGIEDLLDRLNVTKLRKKIQKARSRGHFTVEECQKMLAVFDHLEVTG